ncbi:hypothetical protein HHI36_006811 [Cryptolaemus montrouzieri]|uniref:DUF5641 domain-containing protein n=1 Tax=Cryptolaemus montrouzieri TaxID=559131 RepID=A0ABD2NYN7_9CUCU
MSNDPKDYTFRTPGHFLIGRSLVVHPEPSVLHTPENRLSHFQHVQKMTQHFWNRSSKKYISQLQTRMKWKISSHGLIQKEALVVIKEAHVAPSRWQLGRVLELHPGTDIVIRVVTVLLPSGKTTKRAVSQLCFLPLDNK